MKKLNALNLGLAFAGCFLGAGYVSGQELWQFFGSFGSRGVLGLTVSMLILLSVGILLLKLNRITLFTQVDELVVMWDVPVLRMAVTVLEVVFLFGVCMIMTAGAGALIEQLFGLRAWIFSLLFAVLVGTISLTGFSGMVKAFSMTVPVLVGVTLIFGIVSVSQNGISLASSSAGVNPLMGSWFIAALSFACYNVFGSIAMIAPLGTHLKSGKTAVFGIAFGTALLFIIAGSVLCSVAASPEYSAKELPMLAIASDMGVIFGVIYGVLLLLAMFGTALSSLVGFTNIAARRIKQKRLFTAVVTAGFFAGSLLGFGELIGVLYPLFGYASSVFIVLTAIHFFKVRKNEKLEDKT